MAVMNFTSLLANINVVDSVNLLGFVYPRWWFEVFARYTKLTLVFMYAYIKIFDATGFIIADMFRVVSFN